MLFIKWTRKTMVYRSYPWLWFCTLLTSMQDYNSQTEFLPVENWLHFSQFRRDNSRGSRHARFIQLCLVNSQLTPWKHPYCTCNCHCQEFILREANFVYDQNRIPHPWQTTVLRLYKQYFAIVFLEGGGRLLIQKQKLY